MNAMRLKNALRRHQRGLTLVELMVALVLSMMLMIGVITVFTANRETFQMQEALARIQENGRFATQALVNDIRGAGYWGCGTQTPRIVNTLNDSGTYEFSYGESVDGFEAGTSSWTPTLDDSIVSPLTGSDIITIRFSDGGGARVIQHNQPSADLKVVAHSDLKIDDIVMVSDCEDAAIFQVTNIQNIAQANTNVVHNTGTSSPGNATQNLGKKFTNAEVVRIRTRTWYVRNGAGGGPALWRIDNGGAPQEVVEGIEQLQILYGVDTDSDLGANDYLTADNVSNWGQVVSVRINMLVRSLRDNVTDAPQSYTFNGATVTPTDNRLRQVFTTTIAIRNRLG